MSDYAQFHETHVRLAILRLLSGMPGYFANDSVLAQGVEGVGLACTRDQMRGHLSWLAEQRLIALQDAGGMGQIKVATLTERGGDVAHGRSAHPGVQRPSPKV